MNVSKKRIKKDWSSFRIVILGVFVGVIFVGLWFRAFYVQVISKDKLSFQAAKQHWEKEYVSGERGEIFDRKESLLAKSVLVQSVFARPKEVENYKRSSDILAKILNEPQDEIFSRLKKEKEFVWIARKIGDRKSYQIRKANMQGIYLTEEKRRFYPQSRLAGQLLGCVGLDNHGLEGLELYFDDFLSGNKKEYLVQKDASGRLLYVPGQLQDDLSGADLHLTIDARIQFAAEEALAQAVEKFRAKCGTCLVIKVNNGEILAWANYPFFNPNNYRKSTPEERRNRVVLDQFEPGSTLKPFLVASALEEGVCTLRKLYFCENGKWRVHGQCFNDSHEYAWLSVRQIVKYSSNIGAGKIGLQLGAQSYYHYLKKLGLGEETGVPVPGQSSGILRPAKSWTKVDMIAASFGQGISVNSLQLAKAYLCLANKGIAKPLSLVKEHKNRSQPIRVFSEDTTKTVLSMLKDVVEEDGTGTKARISGFSVGGKTGTAQKVSANGGYGNEYVASFVGLFPALEPKYLVLAMIDEPKKNHYGGVVAAPVVREVGVNLISLAQDLQNMWASSSQEALGKEHFKGKDKNIFSKQASVSFAKKIGDQIPDLRGVSLRRALELLVQKGIIPEVRGSGVLVKRQKPSPGTSWAKNNSENWVLWLTEKTK